MMYDAFTAPLSQRRREGDGPENLSSADSNPTLPKMIIAVAADAATDSVPSA